MNSVCNELHTLILDLYFPRGSQFSVECFCELLVAYDLLFFRIPFDRAVQADRRVAQVGDQVGLDGGFYCRYWLLSGFYAVDEVARVTYAFVEMYVAFL